MSDDYTERGGRSSTKKMQSWVPLAVGILAGVAVWSPLSGSALTMSVVAAICAAGMLALAPRTATFIPGRGSSIRLVTMVVALLVFFGLSIYGSIVGLTWLVWAAAIGACFVVAASILVAGRHYSSSVA